jgi:hypothetical protein
MDHALLAQHASYYGRHKVVLRPQNQHAGQNQDPAKGETRSAA